MSRSCFVAGGIVGELACRCGCFMPTGGETQGHLQVKVGASEQAQQVIMPVGRNAREARGRPVVYCQRPESALTKPCGPAVSFWVRGGRAKIPPRIRCPETSATGRKHRVPLVRYTWIRIPSSQPRVEALSRTGRACRPPLTVGLVGAGGAAVTGGQVGRAAVAVMFPRRIEEADKE